MTAIPPPPPWHARLRSIGVTGTNGKTTTTTLLAAALGELARPVARTCTLGSFLDEERLDVGFSYEGFLETMRACLARGGAYAAVELTSEALARGFARAWPCEIGVFTNLTHDHLDAHASPEHYLASKAQLFLSLPPTGAAILNGGDPASDLLAEIVPAGVRVLRYGVPSRGVSSAPLDLAATSVELSWQGTRVTLAASPALGDVPRALTTRAIGEVFAEDALAALAAALAVGVPGSSAARAIGECAPPAGRFEVVAERPWVVVDYAHTPDALLRTLSSARALCAGRLTVVFGAGGERDRTKRPHMGEAARGADRVVLTSDNPRGEDPADIAASVREGLGGHAGVEVELDRERAIRAQIAAAGEEDVIVVAGKGHEREQLVGGERRSFSDADVARSAAGERRG